MIGASVRKEVWLLLRDRGRLLSLFALPVVFMIVFGTMFKFGPDKGEAQTIGIVHAADDPRGAAIERAVNGTPGFAAQPFGSAEALREAVAHDKLRAGLVITRQIDPDHPIELVIDEGSSIQTRAPLEGALTGIVMRTLAPGAQSSEPASGAPAPRPLIQPRTPPGLAAPLQNVTAFQVTVPGNAVLFAFFLSLAVAITFAHERHNGVWKRMLAAPVPRWQALLGKLVPYLLISLVQLSFLFGLGVGVFGMKIAGSIGALVVLSIALSLCAVTFGFLISSFGGTERQIGSTVPVVVLVMGLLGGCMFPRMFMPGFMKELGRAVPQSWALDGYYDVLIREGTGLVQIAPQVAALVGFSVLFTALGLWRFQFEK